MEEQYKYSLDGLNYSQQSFPGPNEAAYGAYLAGVLSPNDITNGISLCIGKVNPVKLNINIDNLLADIRNDLDYDFHLQISPADKLQLQDEITQFLLKRNPNMFTIQYCCNIFVTALFLQSIQNLLRTNS